MASKIPYSDNNFDKCVDGWKANQLNLYLGEEGIWEYLEVGFNNGGSL